MNGASAVMLIDINSMECTTTLRIMKYAVLYYYMYVNCTLCMMQSYFVYRLSCGSISVAMSR